MKQKEEREMQRKKEMEMRQKTEVKDLTFKPNINNSSKSPLKNKSGLLTPIKSNDVSGVSERLIQNGIKTEIKKEKIRTENIINSAIQLTFSPIINNKYFL